jgi:4-carboxymuconolactone decarboxylase
MLAKEEMSAEQRDAAADMLAGPRKDLGGPFHAWLRSPATAVRIANLGEHLRFQAPFRRDIKELAVLITARYCNSDYEWRAHKPWALEAGVPPETIDAIEAGRRPATMSADRAAVYDFCTQLHRDKAVDDSAFAAARDLLGEAGLIDLIVLCGLYTTIAMTLGVARVAPRA